MIFKWYLVKLKKEMSYNPTKGKHADSFNCRKGIRIVSHCVKNDACPNA
jgi:hypothetical protein